MLQFTLHEQTAMVFESWRSINRLYDQYAKSVGLTYIGLSVLNAIYETADNCTQKIICELTHLPKQSVNVIIRSFLELGYLEMKELSADRRNKAILLTASGRAYADKTIGNLLRAEESVMVELDYDQRQGMISFMQKLEGGLNEFVHATEMQDG